MKKILQFIQDSLKIAITSESKAYYIWVGFLLLLMLWGGLGYLNQLDQGLLATNMNDSVSWGFYIGNFAFFVGVAAAAIMLVIPGYVYNWKPMKEVVLFGELLAISAVIMALSFILVDVGGPFRLWHMIPVLGRMNFPQSLLTWDSIVLNIYFALNIVIVSLILYSAYTKKPYNKALVMKLVIFSIPMAVSIHTVTAFLFNGLAGRPYWNSALLAPKFLASAFCSGPAVLLILFQVLRKYTKFTISNEAIFKIAELMAYSMFINLFFMASEVFKEIYSDTEHLIYLKYLFVGTHGHHELVVFAWTSVAFSVISFIIFLLPKTRTNFVTLNIGAVMIFFAVYIEKGIALIIPGFTPDVLGQIIPYVPSTTEVQVATAIFAMGFLIFTILSKISIGLLYDD